MLRIIRVSDDPIESFAHKVETELFPSHKEVCVLTLHTQYDKDGKKKPGKCSRICKHGYLVCTEDFVVEFPIVIEGGLANAASP